VINTYSSFIQGGAMSNEVKKQDIDEISLVAIILAFFLPPAGVAIKEGIGFSFVVNILLTFLGFFPGIIHALYVILKK
jgi:uncharacterized membrane protein YqaE (UPF0057 family)